MVGWGPVAFEGTMSIRFQNRTSFRMDRLIHERVHDPYKSEFISKWEWGKSNLTIYMNS